MKFENYEEKFEDTLAEVVKVILLCYQDLLKKGNERAIRNIVITIKRDGGMIDLRIRA